jgi:DNA helicase II / ATP-dependent DNA helicase PcrA
MLVGAGPGTGKTRTLTSWIARLIESGKANPNEVLAITFTNRACREMRERLYAILGDASHEVTISTFHSFAFQMIRKRNPEITRVFDDRTREDILLHVFENLDSASARNISSRIARYFDGVETLSDPDVIEYGRVYIDTIKKMGGIDISVIIAGLNQIFRKDGEFLSLVREQYRFIAIDELQDINTPQYELVRHLFPGGKTFESQERALLAIGDPDQAIYGFRGSISRLYFTFIEDYQPTHLTLDRNYRSGAQIVRAASSIISFNSESIGKNLIPMRTHGETIKLYSASNPSDESEFIVSMIDEYAGGLRFESARNKGGYSSFADIAILGRTRQVLDEISRTMRSASVPLHLRSSMPFAWTIPFRYIMSALSFTADENNPYTLFEVLRGIVGVERKEALREILLSPEPGSSGLFASHTLMPEEKEMARKWADFVPRLKAELASRGIQSGIELLVDTYPALDPVQAGQGFEYESLASLAHEYGNDIGRFITRCSLDVNEGEAPFSIDRVTLLTFHAAKGLEFPVVFIAGAEDGITPIASAHTDIEEERRLFYVAMTRAKERLVISHSATRRIFGKEVSMERSRFLSEIPNDTISLITPESRKGRKSRISQLELFDDI